MTGLTQIFADHHKKQESKLKIPKSWEEYLSIKRKQKAFGVWSYQGKTTIVWEGIEYKNTLTSQMSADGSKVLNSNVMKTKDGSWKMKWDIFNYDDAY